MTDAELADYLGIGNTPGWENVIRTLTKKQRKGFEALKVAEEDILLWQQGVAPKPKNVIICGCDGAAHSHDDAGSVNSSKS
jgi:hypothetical protein